MTTFHLDNTRGEHNTAYPKERYGALTAGRLKVAMTLNASELLAITAPDGKPRVVLRIRLPEPTVTAEIASKSLRRAQDAIRTADVDNIVLVLQGRLAAGADLAGKRRLSAAARCPGRASRRAGLVLQEGDFHRAEIPTGRREQGAEANPSGAAAIRRDVVDGAKRTRSADGAPS